MAIYNSSSTVGRMIESIQAQTMIDWELIAVNDGSTDNSLEIIKKYATEDPRIIIINKNNGGVASARQVGIEQMRGEYSIHADSDDWIEPDMLKEMYETAKLNNADMVVADYFVDHANGKQDIIKQKTESLAPHDFLYAMYTGKLFGGLWHKLIKTECYQKSGAHFISNINYCEDLLLLTQILSRIDMKIVSLNKPYYHYILTEKSLTRSITRQGYENFKNFTETFPQYIPDEKRFEDIIVGKRYELFIAGFVGNVFDKDEAIDELKKVETFAFRYSGIRWKIGFFFIKFRMPRIARKFITF